MISQFRHLAELLGRGQARCKTSANTEQYNTERRGQTSMAWTEFAFDPSVHVAKNGVADSAASEVVIFGIFEENLLLELIIFLILIFCDNLDFSCISNSSQTKMALLASSDSSHKRRSLFKPLPSQSFHSPYFTRTHLFSRSCYGDLPLET